MKKSLVYILSAVGIIVFTVTFIFIFMALFKNDESWSSNWSQTVNVKDGQTDPEMILQDFTIDEQGDYTLSFSWLPEGYHTADILNISTDRLGFLTVIIVMEDSGSVTYASTGGALQADPTVTLSPGTYHVQYHYITDAATYESLASTYLCGTQSAPFWAADYQDVFAALQKNGSWTMNYSFSVTSHSDMTFGAIICILFGMLIGGCIGMIVWAAYSKGNRVSSPKYDERQEMERGRGFKYSFFITCLFIVVAYILETAGLLARPYYQLFNILGLFIGLTVYIVYCIWHEAYFALNQNTRTVIISLTLIAIANIALAIINYLDGSMFQNGTFGPSILNALMAIVFIVLLATVLLKQMVDSKNNAMIEDADEEEDSE
ncbi:MAG: hypothetical protein IKS85_07795 [Lachnospiraceae bacterium]|nr:hypothetical protein [Lachnospiraceae bacterium]